MSGPYMGETEEQGNTYVKDGPVLKTLSMYPNPVKDVLTIKLTAEETSNNDINSMNGGYDLVGSSAKMLFVRGDKNVPANVNMPLTNTTLRATGWLNRGSQDILINRTGFTAMHNPFASPIDIRLIKTYNALDYFYVWILN